MQFLNGPSVFRHHFSADEFGNKNQIKKQFKNINSNFILNIKIQEFSSLL